MLRMIRRPNRGQAVSLLVVAAMLAGSAPAAFAQDAAAETRLRKVEAEIRALQRKVFPGGDERFFQPEITGPAATGTAAPAPTTSAVTDLLTRMGAVEAQLAKLTGEIEENSNRIKVLEDRLGAGQPSAGVIAPASTSAVSPTPAATSAPSTPAAQSNLNAMTGGASAATTAVASTPTAARLSGVQAIEKPQTGDAGEDEYSYGFRLWDAKFYPEARQQLHIFVDKYPRHRRVSWGRNLLGRAYLDDGNPREAAKWFLQNYQADKNGGRAPDSLLYLARSMKELKDTKRACIALAEFSETYASEAAGRLKGDFDATRRGLTC